ncbi:hypothetical protein PVL29_003109 [Vitis rotundifolia]|uniref:Cytochrome P450 n=1 Tax=Vitis rotundifolia TaxID=103349 RepID=A0AA39AC44_VITRO|nr:hypothetical protein PVL29_003109 [Vitis rotundifolia]
MPCLAGFSPCRAYWRDVRKMASIVLDFNHVRDSEVKLFIKELYRQWIQNGDRPVLVEMKEKCWHLAANVMVSAVAGKRYFGTVTNDYESRRCRKALGDFLYLSGIFMVSDAIPFLGWLDTVRGYTAKMKRTAREEHPIKRLAGSINEAEQDFIHVMPSVIGNGQFSGHNTDTIIEGACLLAPCSFYFLMKLHKQSWKSMWESIAKVDGSDIKNLVYLQAIVKETLRLYPPGPLSLPHEAMEDCAVAGFHIQAGTRLTLWFR